MAIDKGHSSRAHARLSASGSKRWLNCTPSVKLEEKFKDKTSDYAREGTLAHEFADYALRRLIDEITEGRYEEATARLSEHELYTREMPGQVDKYVTHVAEQLAEARAKTPDAVLLVERRLDFSHIVKNGFGTGDATIISDDEMEVIDLKYGKGVAVDAEENSQLMLYGLGALRDAELLYDIKTVRLTVVQPRLNSTSSWVISVEDLNRWAYETVKPKAELAYKGEGETVAGDHCRWCKAKAKCRAFADLNNELAKLDFKEPDLLTDEEMVKVYEALPRLTEWAKAVSEYLKTAALEGKQIDGYKLVEGRSRRTWADEDAVVEALTAADFPLDEITNTKLKGIGDISGLMSKDDFDDLLDAFVRRPPGKPILVPNSDRRQPINGTEGAKADFDLPI